jgi:hypothetical protein
MPTAMRTELLLILSKPFFILNGMPTVSAILAPYHHSFTETTLTNHAELIAFAVSLGDGFLAPAASYDVAGVALIRK